MTEGPSAALDALRHRYPGAVTGCFGDTPELSTRLIGLIRSGAKRATCAALRDYQAEAEPLPRAGQYEIVLDHEGRPALVLRLIEARIARFCDVGWDFAREEGEDEDLDGWRAGHRAYFARTGGFDPEMRLVCQRFELIEDLGTG